MRDVKEYLNNSELFRKEQMVLDNAKKYGDCFEQWQEDKVFKPIETNKYIYLEFGRGHNKTGALAWYALQKLFLGTVEQNIICCASDIEQAGIILDSVKGFLKRNRFIGRGIKIRKNEIINPKKHSKIKIISSDTASSWGLKPSVVICDELSQWNDKELFFSLFSATGKIADCQLAIISNAGFRKNWTWDIREQARKSPDWHFFSAEGVIAKWISKKWIDTQREILPPPIFQRYILNKWVLDGGSFITLKEYENCVGDIPLITNESCYMGIDLGLKRDRTCISVVTRNNFGKVILIHKEIFTGSKEEPVQLEIVENTIRNLYTKFYIKKIYIDPWQAMSSIQRLEKEGLPIEEYKFSIPNIQKLSQELFNLFHNAKIIVPKDEFLQNEILGMDIVLKSYGWRIDHETRGFSDQVISLGMACLACAMDPAGNTAWQKNPENFIAVTESAFNQKVKEIPDDFENDVLDDANFYDREFS